MKQCFLFLLCFLLLFFTACSPSEASLESKPSDSIPTTEAVITTVPKTMPTTIPVTETTSVTEPTATEPVVITREPVVILTEEEKNMLLKLGMAERGESECTECIALVMRTVLNRVESNRFSNNIRSVILAAEQFTPVSNGSYYQAEPNQLCYDALDMVIYGWDESQGCLYYEWCKGASWHSKNLHLLFEHCDVRFYD